MKWLRRYLDAKEPSLREVAEMAQRLAMKVE
jgi:hypothetical protein